MNVNIYTLSDPRTDQIRYVGKTIYTLQDRLWGHVSKKETTLINKKAHWVKSLLKQGVQPKIELLDCVDESIWEQEEQFYISYLRFLGFRLVNMTNGGDGAHGQIQSAETKAKRALTNKIRGIDAPKIAAMNAAVRGKKVSDETRKKYSLYHTLNPPTGEHLQKFLNGARRSAKKRQKRIASFDKDGNKVKEYNGLCEAVKDINGLLGSIHRSLNTGGKHRNYYWKYI